MHLSIAISGSLVRYKRNVIPWKNKAFRVAISALLSWPSRNEGSRKPSTRISVLPRPWANRRCPSIHRSADQQSMTMRIRWAVRWFTSARGNNATPGSREYGKSRETPGERPCSPTMEDRNPWRRFGSPESRTPVSLSRFCIRGICLAVSIWNTRAILRDQTRLIRSS